MMDLQTRRGSTDQPDKVRARSLARLKYAGSSEDGQRGKNKADHKIQIPHYARDNKPCVENLATQSAGCQDDIVAEKLHPRSLSPPEKRLRSG